MLGDLEWENFALLDKVQCVLDLLLCVVVLEQLASVELEFAQVTRRYIKSYFLLRVLRHYLTENRPVGHQLALLIS